MTAPVSSRFSPHSVPPEQLARLFVGRQRLLEEISDDLLSAVRDRSGRYEAIVAPRGLGKSHLLAVLLHRLRQAEDGPLVAMVGEEENVSSWVALVARILAAMPEEPDKESASKAVARLRSADRDSQPELAVGLLKARAADRPLVIALENLDVVLHAIGGQGQQLLRNLLQSQARWCLLCTSTTWSPALARQGAPLYRMFVRRDLGPMDARDCRQMLVRLAQAHGDAAFEADLAGLRGLGRVDAVRRVVGGAPRAMAHVYPHLVRRSLDDLNAAFFDLADELTPYFQEQINRRPAGQRPLLEALAESWQPLSVGELADYAFATHQTTSGQLRQLQKDGLVSGISVGRQRFYSIREPLFRIARSMKSTDGLAEAFVRLVQSWFMPMELGLLVGEQPEQLDVVQQLQESMDRLEDRFTAGEYDARALEAIGSATEDEWAALVADYLEQRPDGGAHILVCQTLARAGQHAAASELVERMDESPLWHAAPGIALAVNDGELELTAAALSRLGSALIQRVRDCSGDRRDLAAALALGLAPVPLVPAALAAVAGGVGADRWVAGWPLGRRLQNGEAEAIEVLLREGWGSLFQGADVAAALRMAGRDGEVASALLRVIVRSVPLDLEVLIALATVNPAATREFAGLHGGARIAEWLLSWADRPRGTAINYAFAGLFLTTGAEAEASAELKRCPPPTEPWQEAIRWAVLGPYELERVPRLLGGGGESADPAIQSLNAIADSVCAVQLVRRRVPLGRLPDGPVREALTLATLMGALAEGARLLDQPAALEALRAWLPDSLAGGTAAVAVVDALLQLPETIEPYGRLAPPERSLVRRIIAGHWGSESPWLARLPAEDEA